MCRRGSGRKEQAERCKDNGRIDSPQKRLLKRLDLQLHEVGQSDPCKAACELIDFTSSHTMIAIEGGSRLRYFTQTGRPGRRSRAFALRADIPPSPSRLAPSGSRRRQAHLGWKNLDGQGSGQALYICWIWCLLGVRRGQDPQRHLHDVWGVLHLQ